MKQQGTSLQDLKAISETVRRFLEHPEDLDLKEEEQAPLKAGLAKVDEILKAGVIAPGDAEALQTMGVSLMTIAARRPKGEK